jgi:hypothetical protein
MDEIILQLQDLLIEDCAIIIPVLYGIGRLLKQTPQIPDWLIPYLLGGIGIALCVGMMLSAGKGAMTGVLQGIAAAAVSVYIHQLTKQAADR